MLTADGPATNTTYSGNQTTVKDPVVRHDYQPFGEEVPAGSAGRNTQWGSTTDVEQKFTGQIRDQETGIDFFNARYFTGALGRFNSPDPENAGADPTDPQTWNAYAYVRNNPLALIDPTGKSDCQSQEDPSDFCVERDEPPSQDPRGLAADCSSFGGTGRSI